MAISKTKTAVVAVIVLAAVPVAVQWKQNRQLATEVAELKAALNQRSVETQAVVAAAPASPATVEPVRTVPAPVASKPARSVQEIMQQALALVANGITEDSANAANRIFADIPPDRFKEAADVALTIADRNTRMGFLHMLLKRWCAVDGAAAMSYLVQNVKGEAQLTLLAGTLPAWANRDPDAAWNWFQTKGRNEVQFDATKRHATAIGEMFKVMARQDFAASLLRLGELHDNLEVNNALAGLAEVARSREKRVELLAMADRAANSTDRNNHRRTILRTWASADPADARAYVDGLADSAQRYDAARHVAPVLMLSAPERTADWWLAQAPQSEREQTMAQIVRDWSESDLVGAGNWLIAQGDSSEADKARRVFAQDAQQRAPETAMAWAAAITDPDVRLRTMREVFRMWNANRADDAARWLQGSGLSAQMIEALAASK